MMQTSVIDSRPSLYELFSDIKLIGEGASAQVYHVRDIKSDKEYALKVLTNLGAFDELIVTRFKREIEITSKLLHPNLVRAYEVFNLKEGLAYTMEYVSGNNLYELCLDKLSIQESKVVLWQILEGLDVLHKNEIVHRDIKLENILVQKDGRIKICDLGLSKRLKEMSHTARQIRLGTPQYIAPEYVETGMCDKRADIYACGILAYELFTGNRYLGHLEHDNVMKYIEDNKFPLPPLEQITDEKLRDLIVKACEKDLKKRYQSAKEMQKDLGVVAKPAGDEFRTYPTLAPSSEDDHQNLPGLKINKEIIIGVTVLALTIVAAFTVAFLIFSK
jgi:eukaryotic-like serine/threonine-protein kinase